MTTQALPENRIVPNLMADIAKIVPTLEGWCPVEKALIMATIIVVKRPKTVVELGIFGGRSIIPMAMAMKALSCGNVYGIDPWSKEAALEGTNAKENEEWWSKTVDLEQVYKNFAMKVIQMDLTEVLFWHRMKSEQAVRNFADNSIELLHCDSNHSEEVSLKEIDMWTPKLKVGAAWVADDTDWATMSRAKEYILTKGFELKKDYGKWCVYEKVR